MLVFGANTELYEKVKFDIEQKNNIKIERVCFGIYKEFSPHNQICKCCNFYEQCCDACSKYHFTKRKKKKLYAFL